MQWAQLQREDHVMNKLNQASDRLAAFKEVQQQQRLAIAAVQKQVRVLSDDIISFCPLPLTN